MTDFYAKLNNLLIFIDDSIISFQGYKLEIRFLLLIVEQEFNGDTALYDSAKALYEKIQQGDMISSSLKDRVRKIYEFQNHN